MISIFSIRKELEAKVKSLTSDNEKLVSKIKELEILTNVKPEFSAEEFKTLKTEKDELSKQVEILIKQLEDSENKQKDFETRSSEKALEIIQTAGAPAVPILDNDQVVDLDKQLESMKSKKEQWEFFQKNKSHFLGIKK